jgi:hypothetical protein
VLEREGAISRGNQSSAAAYRLRADRRPVVYDLCISRISSSTVDNSERGVTDAPRVDERGANGNTTGCKWSTNGVQELHPISHLKQNTNTTDNVRDAATVDNPPPESGRPAWFVDAQANVSGDATSVTRSNSVQLAIALRAAGIECGGSHPVVQALAEQGVSIETAVEAANHAHKLKPGEKIGINYVASILASWAKKAADLNVAGATAPQKGAGQWWLTDETALVKANEVGVGPAHRHESRQAWHARIKAAIENGGKPPAPPPRAVPAPLPPVDDAPRAVPTDASRAALSGALAMLKGAVIGGGIVA